MTRLIDLSYKIEEGMPVHPYDEAVILHQDKTFNKDGYVNHILRTGMHAGTHMDAPMHLTQDPHYICDYNLNNFIGEACIINASGESIVTYKEVYRGRVRKGDIVLIHTGHHKYYGTDDYYEEYPVLDTNLAQLFIDRQVKIVAMDIPSPDYYPFPIHKMLMEAGILIIENLTDFGELLSYERCEIMAFPLRIRAEASLVRVVARI